MYLVKGCNRHFNFICKDELYLDTEDMNVFITQLFLSVEKRNLKHVMNYLKKNPIL